MRLFNVRNAMTQRQSLYEGIVSPLWGIFRRFFHRLKATILLWLEVSWGNVTFPPNGADVIVPRHESGLWPNAAGFSDHCECYTVLKDWAAPSSSTPDTDYCTFACNFPTYSVKLLGAKRGLRTKQTHAHVRACDCKGRDLYCWSRSLYLPLTVRED